MPIFEYACRVCDKEFEVLVSASRKAACPDCGSLRLEKKFSAFAVQSVASPQAVSCGTSCPDPCGQGACPYN